MLNSLIRFSLRQRLLVIAFAVFLLGYGGWQILNLNIDVFPNLNRPRVTVMTEAHGMAPEEVEALITFPMEIALNAVRSQQELQNRAWLQSRGVDLSKITYVVVPLAGMQAALEQGRVDAADFTNSGKPGLAITNFEGEMIGLYRAQPQGGFRDVALELAEYNITVNAVAPGPIDTERTGPVLRRLDATVERSPSKMTPLGRLGTADEVAAAALFLASEEASYVSGHTLAVAGGR